MVGALAERLVRAPPYRCQRNLGASDGVGWGVAAGRGGWSLHGGLSVWGKDGAPMSDAQVVEQLFGDMHALFKNEDDLRALVGSPDTRRKVRARLYVRGGQKWGEFAAGSWIRGEAGGAALALSGTPLDCAKLRKRSVVAAANPDLLTLWNDWINTNSTAPRSSPL